MKQKTPVFETENNGRFKTFMGWIVDFVVVITLAMFIVLMFGDRHIVSGKSMQPVIESGDTVLLDKFTYHFTKPDRMDVIAFEDENSRVFIKRIIGLPGERVKIAGGEVYINGEVLKTDTELPAISLPGLAEEEIILGKNEYFVLGDNPDTSEDSRFAEIGNVSIKRIIGKVWFRLLPYKKVGFIR